MSGSKLVLDTNIILYLLAGDETLAAFLQDKEGYLSVITELELIGYPHITEGELQQIQNFLKDCTIVNINDEIKVHYSFLRQHYNLKLGDAMAVATALYLNLPFISADKQFSKVEELRFTLYSQ